MSEEQRQLKVLVVAQEELDRSGFCLLLGKDPWITVVGSATSIDEAIAMIDAVAPDVVVVRGQGTSAQQISPIGRLKKVSSTRVLVVLEEIDPIVVGSLVSSGVTSICSAHTRVGDLLMAVRGAAFDCMFLDPDVVPVAKQLVRDGLSVAQPDSFGTRLDAGMFTERESEILRLVKQGFSNQRIAAQLHLSAETVKTYMRRVMDKTSIRNRSDLILALKKWEVPDDKTDSLTADDIPALEDVENSVT